MQYKVTAQTIRQFADNWTTTSGAPRMDFPETDGERLSIEAEYLGESDTIIPLASGAIVNQFGIKLRNMNPCNLVYVVRKFQPTSELIISYKENIGESTSAECRDGGYHFIDSIDLGSDEIDNWHLYSRSSRIRLQAAFAGGTNTLMVWYNSELKWVGEVPFEPLGVCTSGVRFDNVKMRFRVL